MYSSVSMARFIAFALIFFLAITHLIEGFEERSIHSPQIRRKQDQNHGGGNHKANKHNKDHGKNHKQGGKKSGGEHKKVKPKPDQHKDNQHKEGDHKHKQIKNKGDNQDDVDHKHKQVKNKGDDHDDGDDGKHNLVKDLHLGKGGADEVPGLLKDFFHGSQCKNPKATKDKPNGNIAFLNCGLNGAGWNPPPVQLYQVHHISGKEAIKKPTFKECGKYYKYFKEAGDKYGIPDIMLMSFAMQESSCNPWTHGANGEIGMMQLTPANCKEFGVQPQNAWGPQTNIDLGAQQFRRELKQSNGNVLLAVGSYNGWEKGMNMRQATNTKYGCMSQKNVDYLNQFFNGWIQGKDGHSKEFLVYNNLAKCHGHN